MGIKYLHRNTFNRNLYRAAPPNGQLLSAECREEVAGTTYQGQRFQGHITSLGFSTVLPAALSRRTQRTQLNYPARVLSDETTLDNIVSHLMASYFAIVDSPAIKMDGHTRHSRRCSGATECLIQQLTDSQTTLITYQLLLGNNNERVYFALILFYEPYK